MSNKVCVTSWKSLGCTFVDWSIHFLSGQTHCYNASLDQYIDLSQNPITKTNAHGHIKNHPSGYSLSKICLDSFDKQPKDTLCSMYPVQLHLDVAASAIDVSVDQLHNADINQRVQQFILDDYNQMLKLCHQTDTKVIFVSHDPRVALYHQFSRQLDRFTANSQKPTSAQDLVDEIQLLYFKNSIDTWKEMNLTDVWDVRERMALDIRPFDRVSPAIDLQHPHQWVNCLDLWTRTEHTIKNILSYLELNIDTDRLSQWLPICQQWQQKQLAILEFCYNQPHIVDAIVNNWPYRIDLTFEQEVLIQHFLIYQHGLNLKTWQLTKFPSNTQELHKLLEPNIHSVPKIY